MWSPAQYHRYNNERSRPFFDLLAQVHLENARTIVDLGCGSGELTLALAERWPASRVLGVDSSPEMIAEAKAHELPGRMTFEAGDFRQWNAPSPVDLLFSNAAFQWVPDHHTLLSRLFGMVASDGALAFQVPGNFEAPSHELLVKLRTSEKWKSRVGEGASRHLLVQSPGWYLEFLTNLGTRVDAWETTYMHVLTGENAVLEWVKGTALRPVLAALSPAEQAEFCGEYTMLLNEAYPARDFGTVFPFRRIFVVAYRR
jgi:trans-aconitate 2-methyltransferase